MIGLNRKQMVVSSSSWLDTVTFPVVLLCRFVLLMSPHPLDSVHANPCSMVWCLAADNFIHPPWYSLIIPVYLWLRLLRIPVLSIVSCFFWKSFTWFWWVIIHWTTPVLTWMVWKMFFCLEISFLYLSANFHQIRVLVTGVDVPRPSAHQTFAFRFIIYKVWYTVMNDVYSQ